MIVDLGCTLVNYHGIEILSLQSYYGEYTNQLFVFFVFVGVLMILAGSLEFEKGHNNDIQERPSDNVELPEVKTALVVV